MSNIYHWTEQGQTPGLDPKRGDYGSYADFADSDGNVWLMQEAPSRSSGR